MLVAPRSFRVPAAIVAAALGFACAADGETARADASSGNAGGPLVVHAAGSLARPLRAALDTFSARTGIRYRHESGGSLELARMLTELRVVPDVIALADREVFPLLLVPERTRWYAEFARNRLVLAYTPRSRHAAALDTVSWRRILQREDVEVGRADPAVDPTGYRTIIAARLAESVYGEPGLARRLLERAPERNVRPKGSDLVALVQAGELDYVWIYESVARGAGVPYMKLPAAIDLGAPAESASYARAAVRVPAVRRGDSIDVRGAPIVYALSIPAGAEHPAAAERFVAWLLSADGRRVLRSAGLDALERPRIAGDGAPPAVVRAVEEAP